MNKKHFLTWLLIFALVISGCSIEINQPTQPILLPSLISPTQPNSAPTSSLPTLKELVTWSGLKLTGKLVYIAGKTDSINFVMDIEVLDLVSGDLVTIFKSPANSYIYYVTVSPDNKQLIMSYSPPPTDNPNIYQALYIMPLDGSAAPRLLFAPPAKEDQFIQAEWSPDGKYIYFTHVNFRIPSSEGQRNPVYDIYRTAFPNGQLEKVAAKAYWPRLSADSSRLVYVFVDPLSYTNQIYVADSNGGNPHQVTLTG
jgi:Tol biopolymer transport system component